MKTNIGVFFGGNSVEHEVAIISALQAVQNIDKNLYDVTPVYIAKNGKRIYWFIPVCSALVFGVFPWVACFLPYIDAIKFGILGAVISTVATFVFDVIKSRLSVTPRATIVAPLISGFGIYLAAQCLVGII